MTDGGGAAWELSVRLHGEALGRTNDAERLLIDWDQHVAGLDGKLGENPGQTKVSVVLITPRGLLVAGAESFPGKVLSDVGLARPASQDGTRESEAVSAGQLAALDGDVILLSVAPGADGAARRLQSTAAWRRLSAVRSGRRAQGGCRHLVDGRRHPGRAGRPAGPGPGSLGSRPRLNPTNRPSAVFHGPGRSATSQRLCWAALF